MSDNEKYVVKAGSTATGKFQTSISAQRAGWTWCSLRVLALQKDETQHIDTGEEEMLVLPFEGAAKIQIAGESFELRGRESVWTGVTDYLYVPRHTEFTLTATHEGRFALPATKATKDFPLRYCPAAEVNCGIRGSGNWTRQVNNYALGNTLETSHLLVTEVLTPGGNWSSYPPHKHDEHTDTERVLEEIYYYEIREGGLADSAQKTAGFGLQRIYDSPSHPIDVCTEVRSGDTVLVPHGYHGPSAAAPGYDMYYLNVMGGPAEDSVWLMSDDPIHTWMRQAWEGLEIDTRVPFFPINKSEVK
ncbi:5-deoxy-glucuronate isomerase [Mobiluncus mulieris]|uniref:5-deoxy-glucuronate isomerase n=1 Tax=Mobiluncus mulieris TaxID=2052 RepID=A0A7Y0Y3I9_9ACTO|nr:5-deoxy-glucuronate isomerase [Mobiluncus mulieris]MCV0009644.1 5-deoxy-glucuronate isomerase [Mobiluncus mulieris]NMW60396.1 5-deoxy-glucuronate isomerase [Mobiluncus mulieris]NMW63469.1 5-deoxy-glucuronate isomerase [Mobiluncus mulieris]NMW64052.1 5-deoxy-glucuronate isomerase [Mobiluncus mulieris]NMW75571.1 5-deoxy-glucuronate isomerase [Mobiluncus mulieris]